MDYSKEAWMAWMERAQLRLVPVTEATRVPARLEVLQEMIMTCGVPQQIHKIDASSTATAKSFLLN